MMTPQIFFARAKAMILAPKSEWEAIAAEPADWAATWKYLIMLALIPAIASLIGFWLVGFSYAGITLRSFSFALRQALMVFVGMLVSVYVTAWIINALAEKFNAEKNFGNAFRLSAYAYTPSGVAGIFYLIPALSFITFIGGLYGLYLLYIGIKPMMKAPDDRVTPYFVLSLVCSILVFVIISVLLSALFFIGHGPRF